MYSESRCIISLAWTHSCQRSRDLCRSFPALCGAVSSERVAHTGMKPTALTRLFSSVLSLFGILVGKRSPLQSGSGLSPPLGAYLSLGCG